jgi:uncharacterized protein (DUF3084 family)
MVWTVLALLSLIVLGGFISYYGDLQGRRWGKKRVSWFGMRPKHTAILITSLTGAFISLLSVLTVLLIVPPVREVVLRGERAIEMNKELEQKLTDQIEHDKLLTESIRIEGGKLQAEVKVAHDKFQTAGRQLQEKRQQLATKQKELTGLQTQIGLQSVELRRREVEVARLDREKLRLSRQNARLSITNREIARQNYGLGQDNLRLAAANSKLTAQNRDLTAKNTELIRENEPLKGVNLRLLHDNEQLLQDSQSAQHDLTQARADLVRVKAELDQARQVYEATTGALAGSSERWGLNYVAIRQGRIGVRVGSELARRTLDAHMSARAVREQLEQLLQEASGAAQRYGAAIGPNGRAVHIVSKLVPTLAGTEEADEGDSLNALVSNLEGHSQPVVVVARTFSNTLEGEQAPIELKAIDVEPVFAPGQVLATGRIDGSRPEHDVFQTIAQFLQVDVRAAAIKAGTIPQVDPSTGVSEVGKVDPLDLARLVSQARKLGGDVTIRAVAKVATTSGDPLDSQHLRLTLLRDPNPSNLTP